MKVLSYNLDEKAGILFNHLNVDHNLYKLDIKLKSLN